MRFKWGEGWEKTTMRDEEQRQQEVKENHMEI